MPLIQWLATMKPHLKERYHDMTSETSEQRSAINWRIIGWAAAGLIVLLPLVAMQLTDEVKWTASDFLFAGLLVGSVGLILELALRQTTDRAYRGAAGCAVAAAFLLIWSNGAVGIVGSETNDANTLFNLVPLIALLGSAIVRFRAHGLAKVMMATAIIQVLVTVGVLTVGWSERASIWPRELIYSAGGFAGLWLASAWLFAKAARTVPAAK
jgi:hypothetical protein